MGSLKSMMPGYRNSGDARRRAWLWPYIPGRSVRRHAWRWACTIGDQLAGWKGRACAGLAAGAVPLGVCYALGWPLGAFGSALLLAPMLVGCAARDWQGRGIGLLVMAFAVHNGLAIALVAHDPEGMAVVLPDGADYWRQSHRWIVTGKSREYDVRWWLPAHVQIVGVMAAFTYISLGFTTLWHGFHEVDLMNFYVGQLVRHSDSAWMAVALGWHPWSLCRGVGFLFLTFEIVNWSFGRLSGTTTSTPHRRRWRWALGILFFLLDAILKYTLLDVVRGGLAANLI